MTSSNPGMADKFQVPSSLTLEPNPFEQSFAGKQSAPQESLPAQSPHPQQRLPGVQGLTSPAPLLTTPSQWQGPRLSPAILTGQELPGPPNGFHTSMPSPAALLDHKRHAEYKITKKSTSDKGSKSEAAEEDKKRSLFLERNRIAAVKCRQRKKQWVDGLKGKVEYYQNANEELTAEVARLKGSIDQIKQYIYSIQDPRQVPPQIAAVLDPASGPAAAQTMPQHSSVQAAPPAQRAPPAQQPQSMPVQHQPQGEYQNVVLMVPQQVMMPGGSRPS